VKLAQSALKGMLWAYASFFGGRLLTTITTAILGRLLYPHDFGVISFALLALNFIEAARSFGVNEALIYTDKRIDDAADTAFVLNVVFGFLQFAAAFLLAPLALHLVEDPQIVPVVRVMAVSFILNSFGQTHDALLQKELKFRRRFLPELLSALLKGVFSIGAALAGFGVWSLVISHVLGAAIRTAASWWILSWRPRLRFYMDQARELWRYGIHILLWNALGVAVVQAAPLMIGSLLGTVELGYYSMASKLPEMIVINISLVLTRVIFPTYVKIKDDRELLIKGFFATTKYTAMVTVAAGFGMAAVAPELMRVWAGGQWDPAAPLLQVVALTGMVSTLAWNAGDLFKAIGRPDISTKLLLVEAIYTFGLIWVMAHNSGLAIMAALANLIAFSISAVVRLILTSRFLKFSPTVYFGVFRGALVSGILMFLAVMLWRTVAATWSQSITLVTSIIVGGVVYIGTLGLMERQAIREAVTMLASLRRRQHDVAETQPEEADRVSLATLGPDIAIGPDSLLETTIMSRKLLFDPAKDAPTIMSRKQLYIPRDAPTIMSRKRMLDFRKD
jgi:lipopolysaccharide exporter